MLNKTIALRCLVFLCPIFYPSPIRSASISLSNPKKNWELFFNRIVPVCNVDTFVESGTYLGHTAEQAARAFSYVHTIEIYHEFYAQAAQHLKDYTNTTVYHGDTVKVFPDLLPKLAKNKQKPLFWLDGHFMTCMAPNDNNGSPESFLEGDFTPVLKEINLINQAQLEHSIILVDDVRLFGTLLNETRLERAGNKHYPLLATTRNTLEGAGYNSVILGDILFAYNKEMDISFSPIIQACTISVHLTAPTILLMIYLKPSK